MHSTQPVLGSHTALGAAHVRGVPATHLFEVHVDAGVNVPSLHAATGQSVSDRQPTQAPSPSHIVPPLSEHAVAAAALVVPQQLSSQVAI